MSIRFKLLLILLIMVLVSSLCFSQDYQINTVFKGPHHRSSGGYGAVTNKFTTINGQYANMVEVYGGWYINHRFLLGISGAAVTNNLPVSEEFSAQSGVQMSYEYGQVGLMTEYTLWSHRALHFSFHMFNGAGFTVQYQRPALKNDPDWNNDNIKADDQNWFYVAEPGVKIEMNVFRWLRFSPGVSYRTAFGSNGLGLSDHKINGTSVNLTLKFGKF